MNYFSIQLVWKSFQKSIENDPKIIPKSSRNHPEIIPKSSQNQSKKQWETGPLLDSILDGLWNQFGSKMAPSWDQNGAKRDPNGSQNAFQNRFSKKVAKMVRRSYAFWVIFGPIKA